MSDPNRLSPEVLANLRAIRAGEPWPCPEIAVPLYAVNPPNDLVPNSTWRLTPDGVAVLALADERDALRQQVKALTDERAALLAPVGDVDLEEVLSIDLQSQTQCSDGAVPMNRPALLAGLGKFAPALAREVIRLRAALHLADEQSAEAIKRVSSEIVADKWNSTAELQQKVKALTTDLKHVEHALRDRIKPGQTLERAIADLIADLDRAGAEVGRWAAQFEETRLTLAAEIGDIKGALSARWTSDGHNWYGARPDGGMDKIERWSNLTTDGTIKHCRGWTDIDRFGFEKDMGRFNFAREGMLAADARLASTGGAR